jgi:HK97 family phage major capsid protein
MPLPTLTKESTLADVRKAQVDAARELIELRSRPADKRDDKFIAEVREAADFIQHGDLIERALLAGQRDAEDKAREARDAEAARRAKVHGGRSLGADGTDGVEVRSHGRQVVEAEGYAEWAAAGKRGPFVTEVRNLIGEFPNTPQYNTNSNAWLPVATPIMAIGSMQRRRAFVRDLMSVQSTGLKVIPYVRELNQVTNELGVVMVSEGSAKSEVSLVFETYNAVVEKMAGWLPVTDEIVSDAPTLMGYINGRLEYMTMIREEQQVLAGTGSSPQIQGLATLSGTQTQAMVTGAGNDQDFPGTIAQAFGKIENVDGEPDGVVCNPLDFWVAVGKRHVNQFDNGFGSGAPGSPGSSTGITWGEQCIRTRAITAGTAWAGSWKLGSTLFDRETFTVKVFDQHVDYAIRNLQLVLAEKRIAVAWHRPALFVNCTVPQI